MVLSYRNPRSRRVRAEGTDRECATRRAAFFGRPRSAAGRARRALAPADAHANGSDIALLRRTDQQRDRLGARHTKRNGTLSLGAGTTPYVRFVAGPTRPQCSRYERNGCMNDTLGNLSLIHI